MNDEVCHAFLFTGRDRLRPQAVRVKPRLNGLGHMLAPGFASLPMQADGRRTG